MDHCTLGCIEIEGHLNLTQMCEFTRRECLQDTVPFIQAYYCLLHTSFIFFIALAVPFFYLLFKILNAVTDSYLAPTVEEFISEFKISPTLAGVTFLAFANGAPDVLTAIIAGSSDSDSTALIPFGSIFGACLFSTAFIFSTVIFNQPNQTLTVRKKQILVPLGFYVLTILFLVIVSVSYGKMNLYIASVPLLLYLVFIIIVIKSERKQIKRYQTLLNKQSEITGDYELSSEDSSLLEDQKKALEEAQKMETQKSYFGRMSTKLENGIETVLMFIIPPHSSEGANFTSTIISLTVSPLVMAATQEMPAIFTAQVGPIPVLVLLYVPALLLISYTVYCQARNTQPRMAFFTIYAFIVTISVITIVCSVLINLMELMQLLTGVNSVFLGLTVFAWANCIGDYLSISRFARIGNAKTAVAGIFSGQLFNFLLGFGVSLLTRSLKGTYPFRIFSLTGDAYDKISDSIRILVIVAGFTYLTYTFLTVFLRKGVLMRREAIFSRVYYSGFLLLAMLLSVLTDFFYQISCDI